MLACPLLSQDIFLAAALKRGEKIRQEFGPSEPVFPNALLFCTQQILSLSIKAVCVERGVGVSGCGTTGLSFVALSAASPPHKMTSAGHRKKRSLLIRHLYFSGGLLTTPLHKEKGRRGQLWKIFVCILITDFHMTCFLWQLGVSQRAKSSEDKPHIHSEGILSNQLGQQGRQIHTPPQRTDFTARNERVHL